MGTRSLIALTDLVVLILATGIAFLLRFGDDLVPKEVLGPIQIAATVLPFFWIAVLALNGGYDERFLGLGLSEYGKIVQSAFIVLATVALLSFLFKFDTSRLYALSAIALGFVFLLVERWTWRRFILHRRNQGLDLMPTMIVGSAEEIALISDSLKERPWAGYLEVAEFPTPPKFQLGGVSDRSIQDWLKSLADSARSTGAKCIILTNSEGINASLIRDISWSLEGENIDLLLSSSLGIVTGPRISMRVATGLPYVHLDEVNLGTSQRILKRSLDVVAGTLLLITLAPLMALIAFGILTTSGTPVFFRQIRGGRHAKPFRIWKFRTMNFDADAFRDELRTPDSSSPVLKIPEDPRVTRLGRFLRRWSLDELPQLVNVLHGSMSLVGPRPHPFDDIERYESDDYRRLIAKPGMTGLWQVSGRSDLTWQDSLELDLIYIENWSLISDITILFRTIQAVIAKEGAY